MGIETAIILGLAAFTAVNQLSAAKSQAEGIALEGELAAKQKAQEVEARAARARVSFLHSGLNLQGTPNSAINSIFAVGIEDVNLIKSNASIGSKSAIRQGRAQALSTFASAVGGSVGVPNISSPFSNTGGFGNFANQTFGAPLSTGGGGSITGAGNPIPGIKPIRIN